MLHLVWRGYSPLGKCASLETLNYIIWYYNLILFVLHGVRCCVGKNTEVKAESWRISPTDFNQHWHLLSAEYKKPCQNQSSLRIEGWENKHTCCIAALQIYAAKLSKPFEVAKASRTAVNSIQAPTQASFSEQITALFLQNGYETSPIQSCKPLLGGKIRSHKAHIFGPKIQPLAKVEKPFQVDLCILFVSYIRIFYQICWIWLKDRLFIWLLECLHQLFWPKTSCPNRDIWRFSGSGLTESWSKSWTCQAIDFFSNLFDRFLLGIPQNSKNDARKYKADWYWLIRSVAEILTRKVTKTFSLVWPHLTCGNLGFSMRNAVFGISKHHQVSPHGRTTIYLSTVETKKLPLPKVKLFGKR